MGLFKRKTELEKLYIRYEKQLEEARKWSTIDRSKSDELTGTAEIILNRIKELEKN